MRDVLRHSGRHHDIDHQDDVIMARSPRRHHVERQLSPCRNSVRRTLSTDVPVSPTRYRENPVLRRTSSNSVDADDYLLRHNSTRRRNDYENVAMVTSSNGYATPDPALQQQAMVSRYRIKIYFS